MTWTSPPYEGDSEVDLNPDFPFFEGNNCASFVSQILREGSWE
ncbi:MAG: amidase domain-containing protein [Bifidobacteriaceae bacterium]|nr:amidase domain-containing protein [Bifidobacteriaceae bacterium]